MRRARIRELRVMGYYVGLIVVMLSALMVIPAITSSIQREWPVAVDFFLSAGLGATVGLGLMFLAPEGARDLTWTQGMVTTASAWLLGMMVCAVPYYLSGHWLSFLDACFDVMSGFTTTGLALVQDLDHIADGLNMWRFLLTWLGGQGMVVLAITFFVRGLPGAFKMYVGEGKDERVMPNVIHTARAIWFVSVVYLILGTVILTSTSISIGQAPGRAFLHGLWMVMSGWSTGGFAPMSQGVVYYHSLLFEIVTVVFFTIGSFNFSLHWALWNGNKKEVFRNLEVLAFMLTSTVLVAISSWDLARAGVYPTVVTLFRRGFYNLISAHTTTGFGTIYARQFALEWGPLALVAITIAMLIGASASSTAGGFKGVRVGLVFKSIVQDVKRLLAPEQARLAERFHMGRETTLDDRIARSAMSIILLYIAMWLVLILLHGGYAARFGWDLPSIIFESASLTGNVGLSAGITSAALPSVLKVAYLVAMWLGRLEFLSVFVLAGYLLKGWRKA